MIHCSPFDLSINDDVDRMFCDFFYLALIRQDVIAIAVFMLIYC